MSHPSRVRVVALGLALTVYGATGGPAHAAGPVPAAHGRPAPWRHLAIPHASVAVHPDPTGTTWQPLPPRQSALPRRRPLLHASVVVHPDPSGVPWRPLPPRQGALLHHLPALHASVAVHPDPNGTPWQPIPRPQAAALQGALTHDRAVHPDPIGGNWGPHPGRAQGATHTRPDNCVGPNGRNLCQ